MPVRDPDKAMRRDYWRKLQACEAENERLRAERPSSGLLESALNGARAENERLRANYETAFNDWKESEVNAAKLREENERLRAALERLTHQHCGTNRVTQAVRWARQVLGWDYEKGCAGSVEAVREAHARQTLEDEKA